MESDEVLRGIVLRSSNYAEYDRRLSILTREKGKITAFARGARKVGSHLLSAAMTFATGEFTLRRGRDAYSLKSARIEEHFSQLTTDLDKFATASYFMEIADYYSRENSDDEAMLNLLYRSLRALVKETADRRLLRCIYEIRSISVNGEFPGIPTNVDLSDGTRHAVWHIVNSPEEKLFAFTLREDVLSELEKLCENYMKTCVDRRFHSLELMG